MKSEIWFWQSMRSPHMVGLASSLASSGWTVIYVSKEEMDLDRAKQGWTIPSAEGVRFLTADSQPIVVRLVGVSNPSSIHICQGLSGSGFIQASRDAVLERGLRCWIIMEAVEDSGPLGFLKRELYRRYLRKYIENIEGILAIGYTTGPWLKGLGAPENKLFDFAYFLADEFSSSDVYTEDKVRPYTFVFVGRFVKLKRLDWLLKSLHELRDFDWSLKVIGSGRLEKSIFRRAQLLLGKKLDWLGRLSRDQVQVEISKCDCLVLASSYDGWGAVASEALMNGVPVIVSDGCGSAEMVSRSPFGKIFSSGDRSELTSCLEQALREKKVKGEKRLQIKIWSQKIQANSGADYLAAIIKSSATKGQKPLAPWLVAVQEHE